MTIFFGKKYLIHNLMKNDLQWVGCEHKQGRHQGASRRAAEARGSGNDGLKMREVKWEREESRKREKNSFSRL